MKNLLLMLWILGAQPFALAHQASVTYVANEGVLITNGSQKVLFDPFFHQAFGTYQLVPKETKQAIFAGTKPFNDLTAIVISHAHDDHFAADEVLQYLQKYPATQLVAPQQAVTELMALRGAQAVSAQVTSVSLAFNQPPKAFELAGLLFDVVRIPHAGWPSRADVENLVFRVTLNDPAKSVTVMHLGDADPDDDHYLPYKAHWQKRVSDAALPPYWFYFSAEGNDILTNLLNTKQTIGIHVPVEVPKRLETGAADYFSKPGENRVIGEPHKH